LACAFLLAACPISLWFGGVSGHKALTWVFAIGVPDQDHACARPRAATPSRARSSMLTVRQLEAALLARDGLKQPEIAACMGISPRQVERLLADARERAGAGTTSHLVAMVITDGLAP
jgi:DNA-binding CsgD family transcriptional regulator